MEWLLWSLVYPVLFAAANLVDKSVLSRVRSAFAAFAWLGAIYLLAGILLALSQPWPALSQTHLLALVAAGLMNGLAYASTYYALQREEVARFSGVLYLSPVLTALFAALFLGEALRVTQYGGIALASLGALLLGTQLAKGHLALRGAAVYILLSALFWSSYDVLNKYALSAIPHLNVFALNLVGVSLVALAIPALWPSVRARLGEPRRLVGALGLSASFYLVGIYGVVRATSLAPVSLVVGIGTIQPVLVLLGSLVLAARFRALREYAESGREVGARAAGVLLVSVGVAALLLA